MAFSAFLFLWNHKELCVVNSFGCRMVRVWLRKSNHYAFLYSQVFESL